jgi:hypothetical protein
LSWTALTRSNRWCSPDGAGQARCVTKSAVVPPKRGGSCAGPRSDQAQSATPPDLRCSAWVERPSTSQSGQQQPKQPPRTNTCSARQRRRRSNHQLRPARECQLATPPVHPAADRAGPPIEPGRTRVSRSSHHARAARPRPGALFRLSSVSRGLAQTGSFLQEGNDIAQERCDTGDRISKPNFRVRQAFSPALQSGGKSAGQRSE